MTRAIVVRTAGDARLAGAIAEGMNAVELRRVRAHCAMLEARDGVRRYGDDKRWQKTRKRLARKYRVEPVGRVRRVILGVWGGIWLGMYNVSERLMEMNRR